MAYRLFSRSQVFFDNLGAPLAGGIVRFYDPDTTDAANVYSDDDLSVNLGSEETLDSAGRFATGIWGDQSYRVRFYKDDGVTLVSEDDPISDPAGAGASIPSQSGHSGEVLTTNGSVLSWLEILASLLPDMTGHSGKLLTTDGDDASWATLTALGLPATTNTGGTTNMTIGPFLVQFGTDTFPIPSVTPPHGAAKAITFPVAFSSVKAAFVSGNDNSVASHDYKPVLSCEYTNTTLSVQYNINENSTDATANISTTVAFSWAVIGIAA